MANDPRASATLDDVVEVLQGLGHILMAISANLEYIVDEIRVMMRKRTPEERERVRLLLEESRAARENFVQIVERVDARRRARASEGRLRRLLRRFA